ncbi:hypothetical protein [Planctomicrobium piriforme]|uniref:Uncharacterized protein n=1 Tax=Planctomicrobium piriforme TaxID=1576369 RepID=A0A1I3HJC5_9PLAN|nr:hypothetical protein [Planctomicrobium piriforme]SFI35834.1 hypothetical protein SAMN05421753_10889 [Planctomicrobium piriforme]
MLTHYDTTDLAQKAGALHLIPENADRLAEMARISALVAASPPNRGLPLKITDFEWRSWVNSEEPMRGAPEISGDDIEGLYVQEFVFDGGAFLALPVCQAEDGFILQTFLTAIFQNPRFYDTEFRRKAASIAGVGLLASDMVIKAVGLTRFTIPTRTDNDEILWPSSVRARHLEHAVTLNLVHLREELAKRNYASDGIDVLAMRLGEVDIDYHAYNENPVWTKPYLVVDDNLIVLSASTVIPAVRNALLESAERHGVLDQLLHDYHDSISRSVEDSADELGWERLRPPKSDASVYGNMFFQFDRDKIAIVYLDVDTTAIDLVDPNGQGGQQSTNRECDIDDQIRANDQSSSLSRQNLLHLRVIQGIEQDYLASEEDADLREGSYSLSLTAGEFAIFAAINRGDSLSLWQVARAFARLSPHFSMIASGFLDHYSHFRNKRSSYHFGDDQQPDLVWFAGTGISIRQEYVQSCDPHVVLSHDRQYLIPVCKLNQRVNEPVYAAHPSPSERILFVVEKDGFPIWVTSPHSIDVSESPASTLYIHVIDAISFWVWHLFDTLIQYLDSRERCPLAIEVEIVDIDAWIEPSQEIGNGNGIRVTTNGNTIVFVQLGREFAKLIALPDNDGDRQLIQAILFGFLDIFGVSIPDYEIAKILDVHAPVGVKRKLLILSGESNATLSDSGLPKRRKVSTAEEEIIADEIGAHVRAKLGVEKGEFKDGRQNEVFQSIVGFLFHQLSGEVAQLRQENNLEQLVVRHERLIVDRKLLEMQVATHLACYGNSPETRKEIQDDFVAIDRAAIASRFVIELTTTMPHNGSNNISLSCYDRLLALASEIANTGMDSDSHKYGISKRTLQVLGSGRVRQHTGERHNSAMSGFMNEFYDRIATNAPSKLRSKLVPQQASHTGLPPWARKLDKAASSEFGFSLTEMMDIFGTIAWSERVDESGLGMADQDDLVMELSKELKIDERRAREALELITLRPRADFLKPPQPFVSTDVYPWRFNRALSYLRRPILLRQIYESRELIWGRRAVIQAANYLLTICTEGRLKGAHSAEMKSMQGELLRIRGDDFNRNVADELAKIPGVLAKAKVNKVNGNRIQAGKGQDLGDIDVLIVIPSLRLIQPAEVKSFSLAKTPVEMANEVKELFGDMETSGGAVGRHLRRCKWAEDHLPDILVEFRLGSSQTEDWRITPIIIIDDDLITPRLVNSPLPVVTFDKYRVQLMAEACREV